MCETYLNLAQFIQNMKFYKNNNSLRTIGIIPKSQTSQAQFYRTDKIIIVPTLW